MSSWNLLVKGEKDLQKCMFVLWYPHYIYFSYYDFAQKIKDGIVTYYGHKLKYVEDGER